MKIILVIIILGYLTGCGGASENSSPALPQTNFGRAGKPTTPADKYPEKLVWSFLYEDQKEAAKLSDCGTDFDLDSSCAEKLKYCKVSSYIYRCIPEGGQFQLRGFVLEAGTNKPIVGATVIEAMIYIGELGRTVSDKDGEFIFKTQVCPHVYAVTAPGYVGLDGNAMARVVSRCTVKDYAGEKNIIVEMKKAP